MARVIGDERQHIEHGLGSIERPMQEDARHDKFSACSTRARDGAPGAIDDVEAWRALQAAVAGIDRDDGLVVLGELLEAIAGTTAGGQMIRVNKGGRS
jgi:hypothetical protein